MKGFSQLRVKSAVKARNLIDLSADHLTTSQFGQIQPLKAVETIPGGEYPINASYFSRLAPLVEPTYGKFKFNTLIGFVPYCQIAYDADAWLVGKTTWEGQTPLHRYFTIYGLTEFFRQYCTTGTGATAVNSEWTYIDGNGVTSYRLFTDAGKYYLKVLNSLGYVVPQGVDYQNTSSWYTKVRNYKLSAYPLLAFFKLYNDYMTQSQRFNTSILSDALLKIKYNKSLSGYTESTGQISASLINTMFQWLYLNYSNDYFTSAWMNPNTPLSTPESVVSMVVPESGAVPDSIADTTGDNYLSLGAVGAIGQRSLDFLQAFDNWVRRNSYSGSRSVQEMFSRFGIKSDDYKSHYAHVLKVDSFPVQVGDITSTSDTSGASLGDYAGKGIMSGDNSVSYKASDTGLLIVLGWYSVVPMNAYGFDRMVLRNQPFDYYTPEFDGLGADAISVMEYFENPTSITGTTLGTDVFGFTERYNSYRYGRDQITGDFRDMHFAPGDMNAWHTGRNMTAIRAAGSLVAQSSSVNTMPQYGSEYNRIFNVVNGSVDTFFLTCHFDIKATLPILNLNQVVRLGEGDTILPRNGDVIS